MGKFNRMERLVARQLRSMPALKKGIKKGYVIFNSILYKKSYNHLIKDSVISEILDPLAGTGRKSESFFGYYDKSPINGKGQILMHLSDRDTKMLPSADDKIDIAFYDSNEDCLKVIGSSTAYNWQQGTRLHWLDDSSFIFNDFDPVSPKYISRIYSASEGKFLTDLPYPVQDSYRGHYILSIDYSRMMSLRPDYGYRNLPPMDKNALGNLENDGIIKTDINTRQESMVHTLGEIARHGGTDMPDTYHKANHIMISPGGSGFIFIHRYYRDGVRYDRLMHSDFTNLKLLSDEGMVSHMCWVDENTVFGYLRYKGKDGYYFIDLQQLKFTSCDRMNSCGYGDGHPSARNGMILYDTYPDKSRMQHLLLYDTEKKQTRELLELYHGTRYMDQTRCDLHPRFSEDGKYIFFDTVYRNKRQLAYVKINPDT